MRAALLSATNLNPVSSGPAEGVRSLAADRHTCRAQEDNAPKILIEMQSCSAKHESPSVRSSISNQPTSHSAQPSASRFLSAPRTAGNLTPYPRGATASSNAAVIGARQGVTQEEPNGSKPPEMQPLTTSYTRAHGVTST